MIRATEGRVRRLEVKAGPSSRRTHVVDGWDREAGRPRSETAIASEVAALRAAGVPERDIVVIRIVIVDPPSRAGIPDSNPPGA